MLIGRDPNVAHAEVALHDVFLPVPIDERQLQVIQIRIVGRPEVRIGNGDGERGAGRCHGVAACAAAVHYDLADHHR